MSNLSFYSGFNCPSCSQFLQPKYESCKWIICPGCGSCTNKEAASEFIPGSFPPEDLTLLQPGTKGKWKEKTFELTGRIRYVFEDESYMNWWHLESGGSSFGWLADAYTELSIFSKIDLNVGLGVIESLKSGQELHTDKGNFTLSSYSISAGWTIQGELPDAPGDEPFIWMEFDRDAPETNLLCIQIFDRTNFFSFTGTELSLESAQLTNYRKADGWNS